MLMRRFIDAAPSAWGSCEKGTSRQEEAHLYPERAKLFELLVEFFHPLQLRLGGGVLDRGPVVLVVIAGPRPVDRGVVSGHRGRKRLDVLEMARLNEDGIRGRRGRVAE